MWPIQFAFLLYIVCSLFPPFLTLCNISFLEKSIHLSLGPHFKTFQTYVISFSTTQNYVPNVAFLLAVIMNTPKSCHSKEQYFTAHNIYSCNKFVFHKFSIIPFVLNFHDIDGTNLAAPAKDHVTQIVQLAQSVKQLTLRWATPPFYPHDTSFFILFGQCKCYCCRLWISGHLSDHIRPYTAPGNQTLPFFRRTFEVCP